MADVPSLLRIPILSPWHTWGTILHMVARLFGCGTSPDGGRGKPIPSGGVESVPVREAASRDLGHAGAGSTIALDRRRMCDDP